MKKEIKRRDKLKEIEIRLFNRKHYEAAIENLKMQLEFIQPNITANYDFYSGGGGESYRTSSTEQAAIERIEGKTALKLQNEIEKNKLIVQCIDNAVASLSPDEQDFVKRRYYDEISITRLASEMDYSPPHLYRMKDQILRKLLIMLTAVLEI